MAETAYTPFGTELEHAAEHVGHAAEDVARDVGGAGEATARGIKKGFTDVGHAGKDIGHAAKWVAEDPERTGHDILSWLEGAGKHPVIADDKAKKAAEAAAAAKKNAAAAATAKAVPPEPDQSSYADQAAALSDAYMKGQGQFQGLASGSDLPGVNANIASQATQHLGGGSDIQNWVNSAIQGYNSQAGTKALSADFANEGAASANASAATKGSLENMGVANDQYIASAPYSTLINSLISSMPSRFAYGETVPGVSQYVKGSSGATSAAANEPAWLQQALYETGAITTDPSAKGPAASATGTPTLSAPQVAAGLPTNSTAGAPPTGSTSTPS